MSKNSNGDLFVSASTPIRLNTFSDVCVCRRLNKPQSFSDCKAQKSLGKPSKDKPARTVGATSSAATNIRSLLQDPILSLLQDVSGGP